MPGAPAVPRSTTVSLPLHANVRSGRPAMFRNEYVWLSAADDVKVRWAQVADG